MTRAWKRLDPAQYRMMPWKNGGGTTAELAIHPPGAHPPGAGLGGVRFIWRLSIATIGQDGPFSSFEGYERTIMLIEGKGMTLDFGPEGRVRLDRPYEPVQFKGEWAATCALIDGSCRDFNVMVERARGSARTRVIALGSDPTTVVSSGMTTVLFALDGQVEVAAMPWLPPTGLARHALLRIDAAKDDDSPVPVVLAAAGATRVLQIDLRWT
jgi:hypothetical protein